KLLAILCRVGNGTMPMQNFIVGSALIILTGCQHSLVHDTIPTITRTGEVKDVVIQDTVSPASIMARPGDEIRWINKRQTDIQVTVLGSGACTTTRSRH